MSKAYVLLADSDGTMRSIDEPIGYAVLSEEQAKEYVKSGKYGYTRSYSEIKIIDKLGDLGVK